MATILKVRKLANPRRKRRNAKRRNRKMSAKQIRFFGTKRQKAALKLRRKRKANPVRVSRRRAAKKRNRYVLWAVARSRRKRKAAKSNPRKKRSRNPALVLTLGSVNPRRKRRKKPVAVKVRKNRRRRVNTSHRRRRTRRNPVMRVAPRRNRRRRSNTHHRRRRRNPTRVVVVAPRRNRRHHSRSRRNPSLFGHPMFGKDALELIGGGLVGVTASKFIPTLIPGSLTGSIGSSNIGRTIMTGVSAVIAGWAGSKVSPVFGQGVLFGGLMQTLSVALNAFLPSVYTALNPSLGDLVPGSFTVPQNPIRAALPVAAPPAAAAMKPVSMGRAFRSPF